MFPGGCTAKPRFSMELQMRVFWRQWQGHLMGLDKVETADRIPENKVVEICG